MFLASIVLKLDFLIVGSLFLGTGYASITIDFSSMLDLLMSNGFLCTENPPSACFSKGLIIYLGKLSGSMLECLFCTSFIISLYWFLKGDAFASNMDIFLRVTSDLPPCKRVAGNIFFAD